MATLTDEELRALTQLTDFFPDERVEGWRVKPLLAALRASRAEVERLQELSDGLYLAAQMGAKEQDRLRAEVERLTADRDSWKRMAEAARHRNEALAAKAAPPHLP